MVDSIDTMVLMGLYELSNKSLTHVAKMTFDEVCPGTFPASYAPDHATTRTETSNSLKL